jgi:hypothetical protein
MLATALKRMQGIASTMNTGTAKSYRTGKGIK